MSRILLMKPELANLIAAGEVIERPASVVKELVENSIDAGSKNIYIGVTDAGTGTILVKDDGIGMDRDDAQHCFLRHASSKIKTEFDLARIHTLGFRGEAIPSIASVSKMTLTTSTGDSVGTKVISNPNEELVIENSPARKGTIFEVKNLFFNTPARLKYLKSPQVENSKIIETVEHLALGFPNISFALAIDGKEIFKTSGRGELLETIQKIYGNNIAQALYPFEHEDYAFSCNGYISKPEVSYSKRYYLLTFLNNRCIYDYRINKAIEDAYKDYLPPQRYPFTIICLNIDPSLVDVNVHPTKKEVRISMEDEMARAIKAKILETLQNKRPIYDASHDQKIEKDLKLSDLPFDITDVEEKEIYKDIEPAREEKVEQTALPFDPSYEDTSIVIEKKVEQPTLSDVKQVVNTPKEEHINYYQESLKQHAYTGRLPEMHPIGQVLDTYIVCDSPDGFYLIDQHAAAERINYEKTEELFASISSTSIPLIPITMDLSFKEKQNYDEEHIKRLADIGIVTEFFGDKTIKVVEIPSFLTDPEFESVIKDCITSCLNDEFTKPIDLIHLTIANIACKKSIKANHHMSLDEINGLIRDLAKCHNPANCPHGRPTLIKLSKSDIEKIFRRTGF